MAVQPDSQLGVNSWLEEELREEYQHDRTSVDESWKRVFDKNGSNGTIPKALNGALGEEIQILRGAPARIAENMAASVYVPLATSQRIIPVKVIDENRRLINHHRGLLSKSKVSYTHLIGWAIVKAVGAVPALNNAFTESDGEPARIIRKSVNIGLAIDVAGKNGARSLMVPNIKDAASLEFVAYLAAYDDLVARARGNRLTPTDFQGTSISLTNPGTVGTMASIPRLVAGQGAIIAVGAMDYPAEYRGVAAETRAQIGIGKVMSVTCTYDHRIIQGAESGTFLGKLQGLLDGGDGFYEDVFASLKIPYQPVKWEEDHAAVISAKSVPVADVAKEGAVIQLINAYRVRGHLLADLDPLSDAMGKEPGYHPELDPLTYGLTIWDLDREFITGTLGHALDSQVSGQQVATLRDILDQLRRTYCGKIGCEYMNIQHPEQKRWLQQRMEPQTNAWPLDEKAQVRILENLFEAEEFEHFLHARFVGQKRFSLEGSETAIPILDGILNLAADGGVQEIVMGMAHRGRLNVLANVVGKPLHQIFSEFEGNADPSSTQGSGDVKYHLGATGQRTTVSGKSITVSLSPNPSHLEAVDPVVEGIVRPKQDRLGDTERERVIPLLIHGDAAFAGQGVVAETLNLSQLDGYSTGGTIHLIINNQIGFTTLSDGARSTPYSTDVARMVQAPIFHVNGDDPEAAMRVTQMAYDYRQQFKKDVVIDMFCYRRHGHNEGDDPGYTQPLMYRAIKEQKSVAVLYGERLVREKRLSAEQVAEMRKKASERLATAFDSPDTASGEMFRLQQAPTAAAPSMDTHISREMVERVVEGITRFPADFTLHPKLKGFIEKRKETLIKNGPLDWAYAEAMAFGSLVLEGTPVRLSGQDSGRGTFSQRHLAYYDYENGRKHIPLKHLAANQPAFDVFDSSLSEYAVLGFEFGYSVADPETLTMWEAQFGDFANGAQIIIDQFITTAESKWGQPSGLVMLLPHGYEGQGPEHSSARMERFLTLCAEENIQVANCTTPAQYFHLLRRQMRGARKPLVIFTPKSLLRHAKAVSTFDDLVNGYFQEVIPDNSVTPKQVKRIVFSAGKLYYDLLAQRKAEAPVSLVRLEQIYPFPDAQVAEILSAHAPGTEVVWAQEEPRNMGAWRFVYGRFLPLLDGSGRKLKYFGRLKSASPASGSKKRHDQEQADIIGSVLGV